MTSLTKKYYKKIEALKRYREIIRYHCTHYTDTEINAELNKFAKLLNGGVKIVDI